MLAVRRAGPRMAGLKAARALAVEGSKAVRHVTKISDLTRGEVEGILDAAVTLKARPVADFKDALDRKTLLMLFEKPSLRTRVSFETGMFQLGGHAIFYSVADSPLGVKETISDLAKVVSRYNSVIMARVKSRQQVAELAEHATVPVINGLDDFAHPCQTLTDLLTIRERFGRLGGLRMSYLGDCHNNVTYDLMRAACLVGIHMTVIGPSAEAFGVEPEVLRECEALSALPGAGSVVVSHDVHAVAGSDVVYTDSWMSYGIPKEEQARRMAALQPFQVTADTMRRAGRDAIFMNCLPAMRGMEQSAEVVDGPQSVVFDQAENRLHAQKALLLWLLNRRVFDHAAFRMRAVRKLV